jgi:predicted nucleic acid-binding protein
MPVPFRIDPQRAVETIEESFVQRGELAVLDHDGYLQFIRTAPARGIAGGRVYDAVIAETAREANVDVLLTFNERHFRRLMPGIDVVIPTAP